MPVDRGTVLTIGRSEDAGRKIAASQLRLLAAWLDTEPDVPEEQWFKRFPGMTVCEGELVKTFPLPRQHPKRKRLR